MGEQGGGGGERNPEEEERETLEMSQRVWEGEVMEGELADQDDIQPGFVIH